MSTPKRFALALILSSLALWLLGHSGTVLPRDDTKSRFLMTYNPSVVADRLEKICGRSTSAGNTAGNALPWMRRDVSHRADFGWWSCDGQAPHASITGALLEDARRALSASGAEITFQQKGADGRFTISYRAGRTTGRIHAEPPKSGDRPLTVGIEENWSV